MPIVEMPNGDRVEFPDDMPKEQIRSMIAKKFPDAVPQASKQAEGKKEPYTGTILPISRDADGNFSFAIPTLVSGMLDSGVAAVTAPGRAMSGDLPVTDAAGRTSPQAIAEAANIATWVSPASPAAGTGAAIARNAGQGIADDAARALNSERTQLLQSANRIGVTMPVAAASDKASVQQAGKIVSNIPLVGQPMRKAAQNAIGQMDDAATRIQQDLGSGSAQVAGNAAKENIAQYAKETLGGAVKSKYDAVDKLVTQNVTSPLKETTKVASDILLKRQNAQIPGDSRAVNLIKQAIQQPGGLNYKGVKDLRTFVGEMLENPSLIPSDVSQAELKQIYAGLSDDLKSAVKASGGDEALKVFNDANSYAASVAAERETLNKVLGTKSDEAIFDQIKSMAGSTSRADLATLYKVKKAVSPDTWNEIASATIARIGRDAEGSFSPDRFLTGYNKLSADGKVALFGGKDGAAQSIDDLARVSSRFKQLNQYANPSGTGQTVFGGALGAGLFIDPVTAIEVAVPGYVAARVLARPATAKVAADYAKAYEIAAAAPTEKSIAYLSKKAQELALVAANDMGNPAFAEGLAGKLMLQKKAAANEQNGAGVGPQEGQQPPMNEDQRFNEAYRQGNAA